MSETRDLGVPLVVLLAGLAVAGWCVTSAPWAAAGALAVGVFGAWGSLRLALAKHPVRSTMLGAASLLGLAALSPAFPDDRLGLLPWALGALGAAFHTRTLPVSLRTFMLAAAGTLAVGGVFLAFAAPPAARPLAGFALAGAFVAALNVVTSRPLPASAGPKGPRVAVFGGSFDPFHAGHRAICEAVLKVVDRLLVVVSARPPHKEGERELSPFHHRVATARLGVEGLARTEVLEIESRREGPSYTVDTLEELRRLYPPGSTFQLVLGADSLQDFPLWHDWEGILDRADLLVAARPGHDREPPPELEGRTAPITWLAVDSVDVSSTEVRSRIASGESLGTRVSPAVAAYLRDHGLYRAASAGTASEGSLGSGEDPGCAPPRVESDDAPS